MRAVLLTLTLAAVACGGTPADPPQNAHEPGSTLAGVIQCEAQEGLPEPDADVAHWSDGGIDYTYFTAAQCQLFFNNLDAGVYTGP